MYCAKDGCLNQTKPGSNYCASHQPKVMVKGMGAIGAIGGFVGRAIGAIGKAVKSDDAKKDK